MKKIRIFLGGFINGTNAQDNNCYLLSQFLNKEKFEIFTISRDDEKIKRDKIIGVTVFNCFYPRKLSIPLAYLWGIYKCDIAYLPKPEYSKFIYLLTRIFRKKSLKTVEGIFDENNLNDVPLYYGSLDNFYNSFKTYTKIYSITKFVKNYNEKNLNLYSEEKPLYLGVDASYFNNPSKKINDLKNIIFIGNLTKRKGVYEVLELAKMFTTIKFYIVGDGMEKINLINQIKTNKLNNVFIKGRLQHYELKELLNSIDLHVFPSRSEGFGKVTFETAAAGIPSIVYSHYGADEWMTNNIDGFIVNEYDDIVNIINEVKDQPEKLQLISKNAIELSKRFDWKNLIGDWEKAFEDLYNI